MLIQSTCRPVMSELSYDATKEVVSCGQQPFQWLIRRLVADDKETAVVPVPNAAVVELRNV